MDDRDALSARIAGLEALVAEQAATIAGQGRVIAEQRDVIAGQAARIAELEGELRRRGKRFVPKANVPPKSAAPGPDRRRAEFRRHPGQARPLPVAAEPIHHDVLVEACPECGGSMQPTGKFTDHFVEEIPEPRVEVHRFRRHLCRCAACGATATGRNDLAVPGSHVGPRAKLLTVYARGHLGISLGKTTDLLRELFGLNLSTAGANGHLRWFATHFDPVATRLLEILRESPVVHADETGWRIDGKNVWCWCFSNPKLAVYLVDRHRSAAVVREALGDSLPGVLVTDFYAAYHAIECRKQRCLVHLLRELVKLRDELPAAAVARHIRPLIAFAQDAMTLAGRRSELSAEDFATQAAEIKRRFGELWWRTSKQPDCRRMYDRLRRHRDELLVFLDDPAVPPHNNSVERDIRSVAAARSDGGVNRTAWGAKAFAVAKSVIRTCRKNGLNFFDYARNALAAPADAPVPLPLPDPG